MYFNVKSYVCKKLVIIKKGVELNLFKNFMFCFIVFIDWVYKKFNELKILF